MKLRTKNVLVVLFIIEVLGAGTVTINVRFCYGASTTRGYMGCLESEREALLKLKQDLKDPANRLASWSSRIDDGADCCKWAGVVCNNVTGHVVELDLGNPTSYLYEEAYERSKLVGSKINPSLVDLKHLTHLDLGGNDFQGNQIPGYLGSMKNLRYLNLSYAGFSGLIPHQLGNLSNLRHLDLSAVYMELQVDTISWLSGLPLLEQLTVTSVNLTESFDSLQVINLLPHLKELKLSDCTLPHFPPLFSANMSSLSTLDLSQNNFQGPIPDGIQNMTSLRDLDLSYNHFNSTLPDWFSQLKDLELLSVTDNNLEGTIAFDLGNLTSIRTLDLSSNEQLGGKIPSSFGRLCELRSLDMSHVNLRQDLSEVLDVFSACDSYKLESLVLRGCQVSGQLTNRLGHFKNLRVLSVGENSLSGTIPPALGELSTLTSLDLSNNNLTGSIPLSMGQLSQLGHLDLFKNDLNGTVSEIHFLNLTKLEWLDASGNSLIFKIHPNWVAPFQIRWLRLRSCHLGPQFPSWLHVQKQLFHLDISDNRISETIPRLFWKSTFQVNYLNLSSNQINGEIPEFYHSPLPLTLSHGIVLDLSNNAISGSIFHLICHGRRFENLILSGNQFSGDIPDCWMQWPDLRVLNLGSNNFTGSLPISIGTCGSLLSLDLWNNNLSGILPMSLENCTRLRALDVSENGFVGRIPTWIGERLSLLMILNLRSNKFSGTLPTQLCGLVGLHILDVAQNNLSGRIPRCINNFTVMATTDSSEYGTIKYLPALGDYDETVEDATLATKGSMFEYHSTLNFVRFVDFSRNNFSGKIPVEVTKLKGLQSLDLSHNLFSGKIPENIGNMTSIESLDFSGNQLSGKIPQSMSSLSFLSYLDLSDNNLGGEIPSGTQLQSFDATRYSGNDLCGAPLSNCAKSNPFVPEDQNERGDGDEDEVDWPLYASLAVGFVVRFWGFIGPLIVNRRWRHKYCRFLDDLWNKLC